MDKFVLLNLIITTDLKHEPKLQYMINYPLVIKCLSSSEVSIFRTFLS